jgi:pimeloyl-ACP methyl ester carboxylesterase
VPTARILDSVRDMAGSSPTDPKARGSAVLVHGLLGFPDDWQWVRPLLEADNIRVLTPDLPSQRSSSAGLADDADEVSRAIRACAPPVVVAGWSHGGPVISMAAAAESSVIRLIYIGEIPRRQIEDASWIYSDPNVGIGDDGTVRLVGNWWLEDQGAALFTGEVADYLQRVGRRPSSLATLTDPQTAAAWETIPTTVLVGQEDFVSDGDLRWALDNFADIRFIESDHFIIFRHPRAVADLVLESFA